MSASIEAATELIVRATGSHAFLAATTTGWAEVAPALDKGHRITLGLDRPLARRALGAASAQTLTPREVRNLLIAVGGRVVKTYAVWPSLSTPRLIYQSSITAWWLQRAGIIGGGGTSFSRQRLARSLVAAPVIAFCHPSELWVVER
ncbi:MAG: hypothetical protein WD156_09355 [Acidimicrobiia bacterium]